MATEQKQPTMEDMQAIAAAGEQKAAAGGTKQEVQQASVEGMREEAERRGINLSQQDAELVAAATIAQLEARGALNPPPEPVQPPPTAPPAPTEPAGAAPPDAPVTPDPTPTPPRRASWAHKYMGGAG